MKALLFLLLFNNIYKIISLDEIRIDLREKDKDELIMLARDDQLNHKFNIAVPYTEEWFSLMKNLFYHQIGNNSIVHNQLTVIRPKNVKIGNDVTIMNGVLMMSAGGITIEDKVFLEPKVKLISNNHDFYERDILTCKPILIKKGALIRVGSSILPGITVGQYAIVDSNSVVTKDVPDYAIVAGNPAKIINFLDSEKFKEKSRL